MTVHNERDNTGNPFGDTPNRKNRNLFRLWFGVSGPIDRRTYAVTGFGLMLVKYVVEAVAIWWFTGELYTPWHFLNPVLSIRAELLATAPEWLGWAMFVWTLPFLWIAVSMSVRRSVDAGRSPFLGLLVLVPVVNLVCMILLCFVPTGEPQGYALDVHDESKAHDARSGPLGVATGIAVGALMTLVSIYIFDSYGAALFLGTPIMMGATASYVHSRSSSQGYGAATLIGLMTIFCGASILLLFALEGVVCIAMAIPLLIPMAAFGGILGKAMADSTRRRPRDFVAALLLLPLFAGAESFLKGTVREYEVMTAVTIDAPPQTVWEKVVDFPDIRETPAWYFRYGIACPERARIEGHGVGATRYCEFTTGTFVEPITAWDEPRRLAFDVTEQPAPMFELSPYRHIHPPHLDGFLRSNRGEFLLIALPGNRTRLEGRTWYEVDMFPQAYWTLWTHSLLHRIHERVLNHIQRLSEAGSV